MSSLVVNSNLAIFQFRLNHYSGSPGENRTNAPPAVAVSEGGPMPKTILMEEWHVTVDSAGPTYQAMLPSLWVRKREKK